MNDDSRTNEELLRYLMHAVETDCDNASYAYSERVLDYRSRVLARMSSPSHDQEQADDRFTDLVRLLNALGLGDHARPMSPAQVFDLCLVEATKLRASQEAPSPDRAMTEGGWRNAELPIKCPDTDIEGHLRYLSAVIDSSAYNAEVKADAKDAIRSIGRLSAPSHDRGMTEGGWQSIESAPKDGSEILLSDHGDVYAGFWSTVENYRSWADPVGNWYAEMDRGNEASAKPQRPQFWRSMQDLAPTPTKEEEEHS